MGARMRWVLRMFSAMALVGAAQQAAADSSDIGPAWQELYEAMRAAENVGQVAGGNPCGAQAGCPDWPTPVVPAPVGNPCGAQSGCLPYPYPFPVAPGGNPCGSGRAACLDWLASLAVVSGTGTGIAQISGTAPDGMTAPAPGMLEAAHALRAYIADHPEAVTFRTDGLVFDIPGFTLNEAPLD